MRMPWCVLQFNVPRYHTLVFYLEDAQRALSMGHLNLLIEETLSHTTHEVLCTHMVLCSCAVHPHGAVQLRCAWSRYTPPRTWITTSHFPHLSI